jgi:hypothetical protein
MFDIESIWEIIIAVMLACAGGFARLLNAKDHTPLQWSKIFSEIFVSGFAGLMILMLAQSLKITGSWQGIACGMAGWMGPHILDLISKVVINVLRLGKKDHIDRDKYKDEPKNKDDLNNNEE